MDRRSARLPAPGAVPAAGGAGRTGSAPNARAARLPAAESFAEAAEEAALHGQGRLRRRRGRALRGDRLVVIGTRDGVDDLRVVEVLRPGDRRYEADKHPVAHHLCLEAGRAVAVPDGLAVPIEYDADAELRRGHPGHVGRYPTLAQRVDDPSRLVLVHRITVPAGAGSRLNVSWQTVSGKGRSHPGRGTTRPGPRPASSTRPRR